MLLWNHLHFPGGNVRLTPLTLGLWRAQLNSYPVLPPESSFSWHVLLWNAVFLIYLFPPAVLKSPGWRRGVDVLHRERWLRAAGSCAGILVPRQLASKEMRVPSCPFLYSKITSAFYCCDPSVLREKQCFFSWMTIKKKCHRAASDTQRICFSALWGLWFLWKLVSFQDEFDPACSQMLTSLRSPHLVRLSPDCKWGKGGDVEPGYQAPRRQHFVCVRLNE